MDVVETCEEETLCSGTPSTKHSFPSIEEEVVGFEKDAESIIKKMIQGTKELDVISIYGMPGHGKTTLARKVYNNPSIVNYFDVKAWCSVSQAYNRIKLLGEIFNQVTGYKSEIDDDVDIADKLQKTLKGRRYLIVLDDIWKVEAWEDLGLCFPKGEDGSRVMVTTRIEEVAKHLQHCSDPYSLRFLTLEESWELLQKKVFQGESCPPNLQGPGLKVAQHCKGLPLVIVLIAGIIGKMERQESLWLEVANDLSSHALGEQSMNVIQSSYDHLEDHLKPCLLYMGLFPEDFKIPVYDLQKLWMAEEFVLNVGTENMEEAARVCLNDLLNRSLVMVSEKRIDGDVECCTLHDVVREFCCRKLAKENFMQLTVPYNPYLHYSKKSRLCIYIHDDLVEDLIHSEYWPHKPMEFIAHPKCNTRDPSVTLPLLAKLRFVQAFHSLDVKLPSSWVMAVQSLTHLRYLAISVEEFDFKWVSHLRDLQTLNVVSRKYVRSSPSIIWEMTKLRHLYIFCFSFIWEDDDRAIFEESSATMLENWRTFRSCSIYDTDPKFWWRFPNLEELNLYIQEEPSRPLFPVPEVHTRLHSLELYINYNRGYWKLVETASKFVFPSNIRYLHIQIELPIKGLYQNIARLRNLENLKLEIRDTFGEDCWDVSDVEFQALKYLKLLNFMDIREWKASEESFPVLEKLFIKHCIYLEEIPSCFEEIPTLQLIDVEQCRDSVGDSAINIKREIEETTGSDTLQVQIRRPTR
uniref:Late blight resistance protein homolog R1B-12 n=1 Tax=Nicotiana tabacum TaxID=4097 RepID=A0A1S3YLT5_TOBAC|nr:PREDICTED: putative late blight resistance protein homolog R1B-12 [Nicotiana tabacum]XP_016453049.1 PREDICTED: putative late blight resistance protein homolog R1B-12 [Nicotiana tabacum]